MTPVESSHENPSQYDFKSVLFLALAGFVSALLSILADASVSLLSPDGLSGTLVRDFYVGFLFGASIGAYLVFHNRPRPIFRTLCFILSSVTAYLVSVFAAFKTLDFFPANRSMDQQHFETPLPVYFGGGFAGAFIILEAAMLLFGPRNLNWRSHGRLLLWSVVGGILGVLGWASGPLIGIPLLQILQALHLRPVWEAYRDAISQQVPEWFSLFLVWQTGVAVCMGLLLSHEAETAKAVAVESRIPGPRELRARKRHVVTAFLFFGAIFSFLGWQVFRTTRASIAANRRLEAYRKAVAEAPSVENLAPITPRPVDQVLLVKDIGGLSARNPIMNVWRGEPITPKGAIPVPPAVTYWVNYELTEGVPLGSYTPRVFVSVQQFPNENWARYRAKYPAGFNPALYDLKYLTTVTRFGNRLVMNSVSRYPNGDGRLSLLWSSGTFVVTINYEFRDINEEFLKQYLEKYPSSL